MTKLVNLFSGIGGMEIALCNFDLAAVIDAGSCRNINESYVSTILDRLSFADNDFDIALSVEDMGDAMECVLDKLYVEEELKPQKKGLRVKRQFLRNDEMRDGGITRRSSRRVPNKEHDVVVTNKIKRGKEHGLPDSSGLTNMAAVPPNIPVWRVLSDFLLDRMFEVGDGEATAQIVDKADLRKMVSQGMKFRHSVNGVTLKYTGKGTYFVQLYPDGKNSTQRSLESMSKEVAGLIIYFSQIEEEFRKYIVDKCPYMLSNLKFFVEELQEMEYRYNPEFDKDDIAFFDDIRKEVLSIADSLEL